MTNWIPRRRTAYLSALILMLGLLSAYAWRQDLLGVAQGYRHSEEEIAVLQRRLDSLEVKRTELEGRVESLSENDALAVESTIRNTKGWVRDGETVFRFESEAESADPPQ